MHKAYFSKEMCTSLFTYLLKHFSFAKIIYPPNVKSKMDKGGVVGAVFLDLRKAFDTVNHEILVTFPSLCVVVCVFACVYFRKWLPENPQAADWSTPGLIGELTPPPRQDTAVSSYIHSEAI